MPCSIVTSLELRLLLSSSIVTLVGRSYTLTITHFSCASTLPPPGAFAIFSLHCSRSSVVVPVLGVRATPVRIEKTVSTSFPLGKALFIVLIMKNGCTDRRAESSGSLTKTLFVFESRLFGRGWAGLFGRFSGVAQFCVLYVYPSLAGYMLHSALSFGRGSGDGKVAGIFSCSGGA